MVNVRDKENPSTILIEIRRIHPHSRARPPCVGVRYACRLPNFFECSLPTIYKQEVCNSIVGNKQIHAAVIVNVRSHYSPGLAQVLSDAGSLGNIGKSPLPCYETANWPWFVKMRMQ